MAENITASFETAIADVFRGYDIGAETMVRCWHVIRNDYKWQESVDRVLPCIDIRCAPPAMNENQRTLSCTIAIGIMTHAEVDVDHAIICGIETSVQSALFSLFAGWSKFSTVGDWPLFRDSVASECPSISIGGLTFENPSPPAQDGESNTVGFGLTVHFVSTEIN